MFLQKIEASPAALLVKSRSQQKSFLFLLEEKIRRAQIRESEENFFAGWRALASGGGAASLVWFQSGISDKMSSSQTVKTHQNLTFGKLTDFFIRASREIIRIHWELYVRKKQLVNDPGNNTIKTIESTQEFFVAAGMKQGQIKKPPQEETPQQPQQENTKNQ